MTAYYNEFDPKAAAWLRELIKSKLIAQGEVDERSINDVTPADLKGFKQCHFFAGIGGWSYALRLAGWPDDKPVWTGSCPCQPFSSAGKGKGTDDERHLWPAFRWLIAQIKPSKLFGEQVASDDGRQWLAGVCSDLEAMGHQTGASDLCSAGVGSPNPRQRLWWVADSDFEKRHRLKRNKNKTRCRGSSNRCRLVNSDSSRRKPRQEAPPRKRYGTPIRSAGSNGYWNKYDIVNCIDGKTRRIEPGSFPLAHGIPERLGLLRGYGNAINPWVAKTFIEATGLI